MPPMRFEPTTPAGERPQTYALDREATGTDKYSVKGSALQTWTGPVGSTKLRLPDFKTIGTFPPPPPENISGTHFC
jgi:hypothetical protein